MSLSSSSDHWGDAGVGVCAAGKLDGGGEGTNRTEHTATTLMKSCLILRKLSTTSHQLSVGAFGSVQWKNTIALNQSVI